MGIVKQAMLDKDYDDELIDFLKKLLEKDELNGAIEGIAKQVIAKGVKSMSEKQTNVINEFVDSYRNQYECERCSNGNVSTLTDYIFIAENGLCPMCEYDREKYMQD